MLPLSRIGAVHPARARAQVSSQILGAVGLLVIIAGLIVVAVALGDRHAQAASVPVSTGLQPILDPLGALAPQPTLLHDRPGSGPLPASTPYSIRVGGTVRYFRLHQATGVAEGVSRPLLVVLPGWRRSARESEGDFGFDALTGVDIAYVDGLHSSWNAGSCCGYASQQHVDDLGALHQVVDAIAEIDPINRSRVTLAGFSNGGMLALRAACEQAPQLAGIIVVAASLQVSSCAPTAPVTIVDGHGARDGTVPLAGLAYSEFLGSPVTSQAASFAPFLAADACAVTSQSKRTGWTITRERSCRSGVTVDTYLDAASGHAWPATVPGGATFTSTAWALLGGRSSAIPFAP